MHNSQAIAREAEKVRNDLLTVFSNSTFGWLVECVSVHFQPLLLNAA